MKSIQIDSDIYNSILLNAAEAGEAPALILRRVLKLPPLTETIEIDDDTYNYLLSKATNIGESASDILRRELNTGEIPNPDEPHPDEPPLDNPPDIHGLAIFHIPAGAGIGAWNTQETTVFAAVGDTLRIVNDDTVPHRLHTDGVPFPHPSNDILPGESEDFVLASPFHVGMNGTLYDHDSGPNAKFWLTVQAQ